MLEWGVSPFGTGIKPSRLQYAFIVADIFMQLIDSELDVADYWPLRANSVDAEASHRTLLDENNNPTVVWLFLQFRLKSMRRVILIQPSTIILSCQRYELFYIVVVVRRVIC